MEKRTSFKGRVMGLPFGSPTAGWIWAAAKPAKMETMVALEYMVFVWFLVVWVLDYRWDIEGILCSFTKAKIG